MDFLQKILDPGALQLKQLYHIFKIKKVLEYSLQNCTYSTPGVIFPFKGTQA
jgi:hypothetical protein